MPKIKFIEHNGTEHLIAADLNRSAMQAASDHMVPGIIADCGGNCACATCHVYVDPAFADRMPAMSEEENDLLDGSRYRQPNSRLSCQVPLDEALDGLALKIAPGD